jgi:hypothetical protein
MEIPMTHFTSLPPILKPWYSILPQNDPFINVFDDISIAFQFARWKIMREERWLRIEYAAFYLDPILYRLLELRTSINIGVPWGKVQEACRLGVLLFCGEIRRRSGALSVSTLQQMRKLKGFLSDTGSDLILFAPPQLFTWVVFFGYFESWKQPECEWYVDYLARTVIRLNLAGWDLVVATIRTFLWLPEIYDEQLDKLKPRFETRLAQLIEE